MTYQWVDEQPDESWWHTIERIAIQLRCEYCGALPNEPCVTTSGRRAGRNHWTRSVPIQNANTLGYSEGDRDARSFPRSTS